MLVSWRGSRASYSPTAVMGQTGKTIHGPRHRKHYTSGQTIYLNTYRFSVTEKVRNSGLGPNPDQSAKNGPE